MTNPSATALLVTLLCTSPLLAQDVRGRSVAELAKLLRTGDDDQRQAAGSALRELGAGAKEALPALIEGLRDKNNRVRYYCVRTLGSIGEADRDAPGLIPALLRGLEGGDTMVSSTAADELLDVKADGKVVVPKILKILRQDDASRQSGMLRVLAGYAQEDPAALGAIAAMVRSRDLGVCLSAIRSFYGIRTTSKEVVSSLVQAVMNHKQRVTTDVVTTLRRIEADPRTVMTSFRTMARSNDHDLRNSGITGLAAYASESQSAAGLVDKVLRGKDVHAQRAALLGLQRCQPIPAELVPALVAALRTGPEGIQWETTIAIGLIGEKAEAAVPTLARVLSSPNSGLRRNAVIALRQIGPSSAQALPAIRKCLKVPDHQVRCEAIRTVGTLGPAGKAAIPDLIRLAGEKGST